MIIKNLTKVANRLDSLGLTKEADYLDSIIRKLAAEGDQGISEALESQPLSSSSPTEPNPIKNVNSYLDMENLEDLKDKKDFFYFLAGEIDNADRLANPVDISFLGPPKIPTRGDISLGFLRDRHFERLYDKYGQPIMDALWRYIDEAAQLHKESISRDSNKSFQAFQDLRELKNKITRLRNS